MSVCSVSCDIITSMAVSEGRVNGGVDGTRAHSLRQLCCHQVRIFTYISNKLRAKGAADSNGSNGITTCSFLCGAEFVLCLNFKYKLNWIECYEGRNEQLAHSIWSHFKFRDSLPLFRV